MPFCAAKAKSVLPSPFKSPTISVQFASEPTPPLGIGNQPTTNDPSPLLRTVSTPIPLFAAKAKSVLPSPFKSPTISVQFASEPTPPLGIGNQPNTNVPSPLLRKVSTPIPLFAAKAKSVLPSPFKSPTISVQFASEPTPPLGIGNQPNTNVPSPLLRKVSTPIPLFAAKAKSVLPSPFKSPTISVQFASEPTPPLGIGNQPNTNVPSPLLRKVSTPIPLFAAKAKSVLPSPFKSPTISVQFASEPTPPLGIGNQPNTNVPSPLLRKVSTPIPLFAAKAKSVLPSPFKSPTISLQFASEPTPPLGIGNQPTTNDPSPLLRTVSTPIPLFAAKAKSVLPSPFKSPTISVQFASEPTPPLGIGNQPNTNVPSPLLRKVSTPIPLFAAKAKSVLPSPFKSPTISVQFASEPTPPLGIGNQPNTNVPSPLLRKVSTPIPLFAAKAKSVLPSPFKSPTISVQFASEPTPPLGIGNQPNTNVPSPLLRKVSTPIPLFAAKAKSVLPSPFKSPTISVQFASEPTPPLGIGNQPNTNVPSPLLRKVSTPIPLFAAKAKSVLPSPFKSPTISLQFASEPTPPLGIGNQPTTNDPSPLLRTVSTPIPLFAAKAKSVLPSPFKSPTISVQFASEPTPPLGIGNQPNTNVPSPLLRKVSTPIPLFAAKAKSVLPSPFKSPTISVQFASEPTPPLGIGNQPNTNVPSPLLRKVSTPIPLFAAKAKSVLPSPFKSPTISVQFASEPTPPLGIGNQPNTNVPSPLLRKVSTPIPLFAAKAKSVLPSPFKSPTISVQFASEPTPPLGIGNQPNTNVPSPLLRKVSTPIPLFAAKAKSVLPSPFKSPTISVQFASEPTPPLGIGNQPNTNVPSPLLRKVSTPIPLFAAKAKSVLPSPFKSPTISVQFASEPTPPLGIGNQPTTNVPSPLLRKVSTPIPLFAAKANSLLPSPFKSPTISLQFASEPTPPLGIGNQPTTNVPSPLLRKVSTPIPLLTGKAKSG